MEGQSSITHRYATAGLATILVIIGILLFDRVIDVVVYNYFPYLALYASYISDLAKIAIASIGIYVLYRVLLSIVEAYAKKHSDASISDISKLILRVLMYALILMIALATFGVSLTDALAGGAIGGIVIGLAVQTIVSNILSGLLLSASKTIAPGKIMVLRSSMWGSTDIVGRVTRVTVVYTEIITQNGHVMRFPNSILLSDAIFTHIDSNGVVDYPLQVNVADDVPASEIISRVKPRLAEEFSKMQLQTPEISLLTRAIGSRVFLANISFVKFSDTNKVLDAVNMAFDDAYYGAKAAKAAALKQPAKRAARKGAKR